MAKKIPAEIKITLSPNMHIKKIQEMRRIRFLVGPYTIFFLLVMGSHSCMHLVDMFTQRY